MMRGALLMSYLCQSFRTRCTCSTGLAHNRAKVPRRCPGSYRSTANARDYRPAPSRPSANILGAASELIAVFNVSPKVTSITHAQTKSDSCTTSLESIEHHAFHFILVLWPAFPLVTRGAKVRSFLGASVCDTLPTVRLIFLCCVWLRGPILSHPLHL